MALNGRPSAKDAGAGASKQSVAAVLSVLRGAESEAELCVRLGIESAEYREWEAAYLCSRLPPDDIAIGDLPLHGTARIVRDRWGVPHCFGDDLRDLFLAAGVAQAQDRLWQLDYRRRLVSGRLAEILGPEAVRSDTESRTLGFTRIVEAEMPSLSDEARTVLDAFADGVNAWIEHVGDRLPVEFDILEYRPEPWRPVDSLAALRWFWWSLTGRLQQLVGAERLLRTVPPEVAAAVLETETREYIVPWRGSAADRGSEIPEGGDDGSIGSNNWVVGPSRSATGSPILASDPHWPLAFPALWYEIGLHGAGFECVGAAWPGAPPIIFGRTPTTAWARTNNVTSTRDLYHERVNPDNEDEYRDDAGWAPFEVIEERLAVRGRAPVDLRIRLTEHGPVVNDIIDAVDPDGDGPITLRWLGQEELGDIQKLLDLARARNASEVRAVFSGWRLSVWNAIYADADGNFGYQMVGQVPRRGIKTRGTRPAYADGHEWEGYVETDRLPGLHNPERGWAASANNPPAPPGYPEPLYGTYDNGYRFRRIARYLGAGPKLTLEDTAALHSDSLSQQAFEIAASVARLMKRSADQGTRAAGEVLERWNCRFDGDQQGALIWAALWPRFLRAVQARIMPKLAADLNATGAGSIARRLVEGESVPFFQGDAPALIEAAADDALSYLRSIGGGDLPVDWASAHAVTFRHPLATTPALERVLNRGPFPTSGGEQALNNRHYRETGDGFEMTGGVSFRIVSDLGDPSRALATGLTGQSGQPGSPHYDDQIPDFLAGGYHPLLLDHGEIEANATGTTLLRPE